MCYLTMEYQACVGGRHMRREALAGRANRAHFEKEMLKANLKKRTDPFERRAVDYEHAAKRTGKKNIKVELNTFVPK